MDALYGHIVLYLGKLSKTNLTDEQAEELTYLLQTADRFENMGDIMQNNMIRVGSHRIEEEIVVSEGTLKIIGEYHQEVASALKDTGKAVAQEDTDAIKRVRETKDVIASLTMETAQRGIERLTADAPNRLKTYTREREFIEHMDRIYRLCRRITGSAPTKN